MGGRLWTRLLSTRQRMSPTQVIDSRTGQSYSAAIGLLNSLQTNAAALEVLKAKGPLLNRSSLPEMRDYLTRLGYSTKDLAPLNIIHVAGTKGKGSTSAFCSSILTRATRAPTDSGLKIGLYTSPHLLAVRERIRINGVPLNADLFANYFFQVWDRLESTQVCSISVVDSNVK
jgi:folylpolyglutamate synthase